MRRMEVQKKIGEFHRIILIYQIKNRMIIKQWKRMITKIKVFMKSLAIVNIKIILIPLLPNRRIPNQ
jgi:hypothetical protein